MRWLSLLVLVFGTPIFAASPVEELLARVPSEATVHIVVQDVQKHWKHLQASPFADWFGKSDFGLKIKNEPTIKQLLAAEQALPELLGLTSKQLLEEAIGPAVVLAYVPATSGEAVVFLTKSPKPATLIEFWKNLNAQQTKAGEITKLVPAKIGEFTYTERQKPDGRADYFAVLDDGFFIYTASKPVLESALKRPAKTEAPILARFRELVTKPESNRLVTVLIDPKSIDKQLLVDEQASGNAEEKAFLQQFRKLVSSMKSVGFTLDVERGADVSLRVCFDRPALPAEFAPILKPDRKASSLWSGLPQDCLLSISGRLESDSMLPLLLSFLSTEAREQFEKMQRDVVGPVIGKTTLANAASGLDWAVWLQPVTKANPWPALAVAIRFHSAKSNSLDGVLSGCDFVAQFIRVQYNKVFDDGLKIEEKKSGDHTHKTIKARQLLPDGVEPTFGLKDDVLVVSSHPTAWLAFDPKSGKAEDPSLIARLQVAALANELKQNGKTYAGLMGVFNGATAEANEQALPALIGTLELFDHIELHQSVAGDVVSVSFKLQTVKALK